MYLQPQALWRTVPPSAWAKVRKLRLEDLAAGGGGRAAAYLRTLGSRVNKGGANPLAAAVCQYAAAQLAAGGTVAQLEVDLQRAGGPQIHIIPADRDSLRTLHTDMWRMLDPLLPFHTRNAATAAAWLRDTAQVWELSDLTGWWPYPGIEQYLGEVAAGDGAAAEARFAAFYAEQWPQIRADMEARVEGSCVDRETRHTFRECLDAHAAGFYRCVCRGLLMEIERALRVSVNQGDLRADLKPAAELRNLMDGETTRRMCGDMRHSQMIAWHLQNHLFASIPTDHDRQQDWAVDINRHAAAHGLIAYREQRQSINVLILAVYVFQLLSYRHPEGAQTAAGPAAATPSP